MSRGFEWTIRGGGGEEKVKNGLVIQTAEDKRWK